MKIHSTTAILLILVVGLVACGSTGQQQSTEDAAVTDPDSGEVNPDGSILPDGAVGPDGQVGVDAGPAADAAIWPDAGPLVGLPYPVRDTYRIKGINPDFWPNKDEFVTQHTGVVAVNLVWFSWEPSPDSPPCGGSQQEYDGRCYNIPADADDAIRGYTDRGIVVTGVLYGVPAWARTGNTGCSPITGGFEIFCTPDDPSLFGRFAGMLASRYDGLSGNGRVADFVIHNEINTNAWFDIGCGQGVPCDANAWIGAYADNYAAAYDLIKGHQSEAKVLLSFEHHFDTEYDLPADDFAVLSVKTFLTEFDALIGNRMWQVAYHPYAPNLLSPVFSPLDLPKVTYGNIGVLLQWLRVAFPSKPWVWDVQLTESGISSGAPGSNETLQAAAVCDTFINVLGTPGITSYIYHRMQDHPSELQLQVGLARTDGSLKPAWAVWAGANHIDDNPPQLHCGFEHLPYTRLVRSVKDQWMDTYWTSTRLPPSDFVEEQAWYLLRAPEPGTQLLFECLLENSTIGEQTFLTSDVGCEGHQGMGPVGYIWTNPITDSVTLYRCRSGVAGFEAQFVSADPGCEGGTSDGPLGHALPAP